MATKFRVIRSYENRFGEMIDECVRTFNNEAAAYAHAQRLSSLGHSAWVQSR